MSTFLKDLYKKKLITPPKFILDNSIYLTMVGSVAYGVSTDTSDEDLYGICIPPKDILFPHLNGEILGYDQQTKRFEQYQQHHITYSNVKEYDITIYNIVKYFRLCADNNPNMLDSLFVPENCIKHNTPVGVMIRENRKLFLSKKAWHTFKGYAYAQLHKMNTKEFLKSPKRRAEVEKHGYSLKFAYHVVRLVNQIEQLLTEGDMDLQRSREQLKSIRRGDWSKLEIEQYFTDKEKQLENIYNESNVLPYKPREKEIKQLLVDCLEHHYGDLSSVINLPDKYKTTVNQIKKILEDIS